MGFLTDQAHGEQEVLATFALQQISQIRAAAHGLDDEQLRSTPSASELSLAWLVAHAAKVARDWGQMIARAPEPTGQDDHADEVPEGATAEELLAQLDDAAAELGSVLRGDLDLSTPVPVPEAPWFPPELAAWEVRWVVAHLVAELARHAGHADIIRESIDGKGSYELNDLAEGKEPVDWSA